MDPMGAAGAVSRMIQVPGADTVELRHPRSMPEEFVQRTLIPVVESSVRSLVYTATAIHRAVVTAYTANELAIDYLAWDARVMRQDVIPIVATVHAHQRGRNQLASMGLDPDLEDAAREALDNKRRRRIGY